MRPCSVTTPRRVSKEYRRGVQHRIQPRAALLLDLKLRDKVVKKFKELPFSRDAKVFYNLEPRILQMPGYSPGNTEAVLDKYGMERGDFCFEISEK